MVTAMPTKEELKQLQALPLDLKIARTKQRIREWVRHYGVNGVYISFSGGKDSTVLLHIARKMYPEIEAVFVNTGLEYPEIQKFAMSFPNVKVVHPKKTFKQVMAEYGYPLISKTVSHSVGVLRRNPDGRVAHNLFAPRKTRAVCNVQVETSCRRGFLFVRKVLRLHQKGAGAQI